MADRNAFDIEMAWQFMTPMASALWGTTLALHSQDPDGGIAAADAAVARLNALGKVRSLRPEPADEAARTGIYMELEEFSGWYPIACRIQHASDKEYQGPTREQIEEAYERYARGRCDYY